VFEGELTVIVSRAFTVTVWVVSLQPFDEFVVQVMAVGVPLTRRVMRSGKLEPVKF